MRLTIARKIALAVIAITIACIGTMAWVTSANLKRGFIGYLNGIQAQDLGQLCTLIAVRHDQEGNFDWLRHRPAGLRSVIDQMSMQVLAEDNGQRRQQAPPPPGEGRNAYGRPPPPRPEDLERDRRGELRGPPRAEAGLPPQRRDPPPPRPEPPPDAPPEGQAPPGARDAMGFASRISIVDTDGHMLMGPPDLPEGPECKVISGGQPVAIVRLRPLRMASGADDSATGFLREQLNQMLWLSGALVLGAVLVAMVLARHLLRPVQALRSVTGRIARGELDARAPLLSRDELAELALHVNEMAESLEAAERQRKQMIADISHELRTPLTVIRGELEALLDGIRKADPQALESLHAEVLRLNKLVEDLHQLTLADTGGLQYHWQQVDLSQLLPPLLERFAPRAAKAGLELRWKLPESPLTLQADPDRLTQILINLLENSVRYTDAGGVIQFGAAAQAGGIEIRIDDSAPGVPAGAHATLFERLYRVDRDRSRAKGGSGLGLAIVKALVEAHRGSIEAQPSPLGGVAMVLRLPR